jgi:hypothetical protein
VALNMLLGCTSIFSTGLFHLHKDGRGSGENNGIWGSQKGGGSTRANSIFMKFNRETKRPVTTIGKIIMSNSEV